MKKLLLVFFALALMITGCSDKSGLSEAEKAFFNTMGKKIPYMSPDTTAILATTNEFDITNHDIMVNVFQGMRGDTSIISNVDPQRIEAFIKQVVTLKAQQDILIAESEKSGISVAKDSIDAFIEKNLYAPNGGKEAFMEQLKVQQIDMDFVREDVRKNLLIMKYIDDVLMADVETVITDDEVQQYYDENKDHYQQETVSARHILFMTQGKSDSEKVEVRRVAKGVLERAKSGEDFTELVSEYSEDPGSKENGGLYENFPRGYMVQAFEDASFNMEVGEISGLVETPYGFHIIKKVGHQYGYKLDEVRDEIENILQEEKKEAAFPPILDTLVAKYDFNILI